MKDAFWHEKWEKGEIGFHQSDINALLQSHLKDFALPQDARVFVPLCGKTLDIGWLLSRGYRVAGIELSEIAVKELFEELGVEPEVSETGKLKHFQGPQIDIFCGDIFKLTADILGKVDVVYDRAALVALPPDIRTRYAAHLANITSHTPQLLICFEYADGLIQGPPFSIDEAEVHRLYDADFTLTRLAAVEMADGLKGKKPATETAWKVSA